MYHFETSFPKTKGIAAGATYGVAKGATIIPVKVLDSTGRGYSSDVLAAINWIKTQHEGNSRKSVANMSLGGRYSQDENDAIASAVNSGVVMVVAAGNDYGNDACDYSPASASAAITVGSTTIQDAKSDFSNVGPCVDLFAPGTSVKSAWIGSDTSTATISGTSIFPNKKPSKL